jgi:hypothetical protein
MAQADDSSIPDEPAKEKFSPSPLEAKISLFRSATKPKPMAWLTVAQALDRIRTGTYRTEIEALRGILSTAGKKTYTEHKNNLRAVTWAGLFSYRNNASLTRASGILPFDLDGLSDLDATRQQLRGDPYVLFLFTSPSNGGLKGGVLIPVVADDAGYKVVWRQVEAYLADQYRLTIDPSRKDVSGLCYVSWDPELYVNPEARCFPVAPGFEEERQLERLVAAVWEAAPLTPTETAPQTITPHARPMARPTASPPPSGTRCEWYARRALTTAVNMIDASIPPDPPAPGNRHDTRLKAARLLGGYVAGGLLGYADA